MTRNDYEEIEAYATVAMMGLLSAGGAGSPPQVARDAFEIAEEMQKERIKRLGDKPPFDC
ncbi:hypothetical protein HX813_24305 [Pseudomonas yamanorum]|uniref:hypothetical protein n=1 Tax=Pseudomonas yamanorum TaxID=515393 RepID=UPI0015A42E65|nr:hypothetical protein [Pseudomonas yamanorum]NVZ91361.1 hypothetical protein [Pseudomonas yamanorum]